MTALLTLFLAVAHIPATVEEVVPNGVPVYQTAYTCVHHPHNAMTTTPGMCVATYTGGRVDTPGMACPIEWLGKWFYAPPVGIVRCDDLPARQWWQVRENVYVGHVDLRITAAAGGYWRAMELSAGEAIIYEIAPIVGQERKGV